MSVSELPWFSIKDVCGAYGCTFATAKKNIINGTFPVPTYKVGNSHVVDKVVHEKYFQAKRNFGLRSLQNNKAVSDQMIVSYEKLEVVINQVAVSVHKALGHSVPDGVVLRDGTDAEKASWDTAVVAYINEHWSVFDKPEEVIDNLLSSAK